MASGNFTKFFVRYGVGSEGLAADVWLEEKGWGRPSFALTSRERTGILSSLFGLRPPSLGWIADPGPLLFHKFHD